MGRNAAALLVRAADQERDEQWHEASESVYRYLQLLPDDAEARIRLAEDFSKSATMPRQKIRAAELYAVAIGYAPERSDLRREYMRLLAESGDYSAALSQADEYLKSHPKDDIALRVRAQGLYSSWRLREAVSRDEVLAALLTAHDADPGHVALALSLAGMYLRDTAAGEDAQRRASADTVMQELIDAAGADHRAAAYLARYQYRSEFGLPGADEDLDQALAADKVLDTKHQNIDALMAGGARAFRSGDHEMAIRYFSRAVEALPDDRRGYLALGRVYAQQDENEKAYEVLRRGVERAGETDLGLQVEAASALISLQRLKQAAQATDRLEKQVALTISREQPGWLMAVNMLRAKIALAENDHFAAVGNLHRIASLQRSGARSMADASGEAQVQWMLGQSYAALGAWDEAGSAYGKAAESQPQLAALRLAAAAAWNAAGRVDEAVRQYEEGLAIDDNSPAAWIAFSATLFQQQVILPSPQRDWTHFEEALRRAQGLAPDSTTLKLLEADFEATRGRLDLALELLHACELAAGDDAALLTRVALRFEQLHQPGDADRLLASLRKQSPGSLQAMLLETELLSRRGQYDTAVERLAKGMPGLSANDRPAAQRRLAFLHLAHGKADLARAAFNQLVKDEPRDQRLLQLLDEMALDRGELDEAQKYEDRLRDLEGDIGTVWRLYRAQRLLTEAVKSKEPVARRERLAQATELQQRIEQLRPSWGLAHLLKARLLQAAEVVDRDAAIQAYYQAIQLGENRVSVFQDLVFLLYYENRVAEAGAVLERLRDADRLPTGLTPIAMAIDARQGNLARAIESAREEVKRQPDDALSHLRLAQLLSINTPAADQAADGLKDDVNDAAVNDAAVPNEVRAVPLEEAESEYQEALRLAPDDARPWMALLSYYVSKGNAAAAEETLQELQKSELIADATRPFLAAQGYQLLGKREEAANAYREAIVAAPDSVAVQLQTARFFYTSEPKLAEQCLLRAREIDPANPDARRMLAAVLATNSENERDLEQVWALLDDADQANAPLDRRLNAILLLRQGGAAYRQRAQKILEGLVNHPSETAPVDRLLLARLYEKQGDSGAFAAQEQLQSLVNREKPEPDYLAAYVDFLLRHDQSDEAAAALEQLEAAQPATKHLRTLTLRSRWLNAQRRLNEVEPLVQSALDAALPKLEKPVDHVPVLLAMADLYGSLELAEQAEATYRRAVAIQPEAYAALALWLARHKRANEAIDLCLEAARDDATPKAAMQVANVLTLAEADSAVCDRAEPVLEAAVAKHAENIGLLFSVATVRLMQGKNDAAVRMLRKALAIDPRNVPAMNNLALLLAGAPQTQDEALDYVNRALTVAGQSPELVDSKGWVLLLQRKAADAEAMFREAIGGSPSADARYYVHLALACQSQGKLDDARQALNTARGRRLDTHLLSPEERSQLSALEAVVQ